MKKENMENVWRIKKVEVIKSPLPEYNKIIFYCYCRNNSLDRMTDFSGSVTKGAEVGITLTEILFDAPFTDVAVTVAVPGVVPNRTVAVFADIAVKLAMALLLLVQVR